MGYAWVLQHTIWKFARPISQRVLDAITPSQTTGTGAKLKAVVNSAGFIEVGGNHRRVMHCMHLHVKSNEKLVYFLFARSDVNSCLLIRLVNV